MGSGLTWTIFRPLGIYGKGKYWRRYVRSFRKKRFVRIYGNGAQLRQYVYDEDVARALVDALCSASTHGKIYNLAGVPFTLSHYLQTIRRLTSSSFLILRIPLWAEKALALAFGPFSRSVVDRFSRVEAYCRDETMDIDDLRRDIGFQPISIEQGLGRVVAALGRLDSDRDQ